MYLEPQGTARGGAAMMASILDTTSVMQCDLLQEGCERLTHYKRCNVLFSSAGFQLCRKIGLL